MVEDAYAIWHQQASRDTDRKTTYLCTIYWLEEQ
jgi:hypothetical protein